MEKDIIIDGIKYVPESKEATKDIGYCSWCGSPMVHGGYYKDGFNSATGEQKLSEYYPKCSSGLFCFFKGARDNSSGGGYEP